MARAYERYVVQMTVAELVTYLKTINLSAREEMLVKALDGVWDSPVKDTVFEYPCANDHEQKKVMAVLDRKPEAVYTTVVVESYTLPDVSYTVVMENDIPFACSCPSYWYGGGNFCKHMGNPIWTMNV